MRYLVYDIELKRPGCALLQAALGGDDTMLLDFPTESWLTAPTDNLRTYELNDEQYHQAVKATLLMLRKAKTNDMAK